MITDVKNDTHGDYKKILIALMNKYKNCGLNLKFSNIIIFNILIKRI